MLIALLGAAGPASGQLSPGKLSDPHSHLEGIRNCNKCHELGNREVQRNCLECHGEIAAQRDSGRGLHAGDEFGTCVDCHVEHLGEDYELIYWEGGKAAFDHRQTGYELVGKHVGIDCGRCHRPGNIRDRESLRGAGKDLNRTFLGLTTDCAACHEDRHAGQLGADCSACHDPRAWRPAAGFDHDRAAFRLVGRHARVDCAKCHLAEALDAGAEPTPRYRPVAHAACTDCHRDPHQGALGPRCADCHNPSGWLDLAGGGFDHDRTRYPLRGRHAGVSCAKCHGADSGERRRAKPSFAACTDCHGDEHGGRAAGRQAWLDCESCHSVEGFRPANYTLGRHAESRYPLLGAHLAVPCDACHRRPADGKMALVLAPAADDCLACHADPHGTRFAGQGSEGRDLACSSCHSVESWRAASASGGFDHGRTAFPLTGRHLQAACRKCHRSVADGSGERLEFKGAPAACRACHDDPHAGQFAGRGNAADGGTDCAACHVTRDWLAEKFDHDTASRFPLRGGHERTPCASCHRTETTAEGGRLVRYLPLPTRCADCHAHVPTETEGSGP